MSEDGDRESKVIAKSQHSTAALVRSNLEANKLEQETLAFLKKHPRHREHVIDAMRRYKKYSKDILVLSSTLQRHSVMQHVTEQSDDATPSFINIWNEREVGAIRKAIICAEKERESLSQKLQKYMRVIQDTAQFNEILLRREKELDEWVKHDIFDSYPELKNIVCSTHSEYQTKMKELDECSMKNIMPKASQELTRNLRRRQGRGSQYQHRSRDDEPTSSRSRRRRRRDRYRRTISPARSRSTRSSRTSVSSGTSWSSSSSSDTTVSIS